MPGAASGAGFDDLGFAPKLGRVLVPAGGTGELDLIDPATHAVDSIAGFTTTHGFGGGHGAGTTSADEGDGFLYASDRNARKVDVVDAAAKKIVASAPLSAGPDYVRWVAPTREVWVTQPGAERIEVFTIGDGKTPAPKHAGVVEVKGGPESLVVDAARGRAYSHLWKGKTVAIDLKTRKVVATWPNGCEQSQGIALDAKRGFLFAACGEGKASVLDVDHDGKILSTLSAGDGIDVIAYDAAKAHLYLPGEDSATMAIAAVSSTGSLSLVRTVKTAKGAHCVAADEHGAWVCDPDAGRILFFSDPPPVQ